MNMIDAKQVMAMAEYSADKARAKLDDAIDAEETRDELIAARAQEIEAQRLLVMAPIDVVCGMQSVMEGGSAPMIARLILANDMDGVGVLVRALVHRYISDDSEVMAQDWMMKIEREANLFGEPR
jgi:hypothetical protein